MNILVINGANLNLTGTREPGIYGKTTLKEIESSLAKICEKKGHEISFFQSNHEGEIIDQLHMARACDAVILNAGAFTHYSYSIRDAIASIDTPVVEVHLSNINAREDFRKNSVIAEVCKGSICGFGKHSYLMALQGVFSLYGEI